MKALNILKGASNTKNRENNPSSSDVSAKGSNRLMDLRFNKNNYLITSPRKRKIRKNEGSNSSLNLSIVRD